MNVNGIELINGSWEQTQVYILDKILKEIINKPDINVIVNPPVVHIDLDDILVAIENLGKKIDDIQPLIVIDKIQFTNHIDRVGGKIKKRTAKIFVGGIKVAEVDTTKWIIVQPNKVKSGWVEALWYNFGSYKVLSNKLFWFVKDDLMRTLLIKKPINPTKQFYLEAFEEARAFGLDLSNYYKNKIEKI